MFTLAIAAAVIAVQDTDATRLPIGTPGTVVAQPGRITSTRTSESANIDDVAKAADGKRLIFLGEQHATAAHQQLEANIIEALVRRGRRVVVGLEMYTRPKQGALNDWSNGKLDEAAFLEQSDWKGQWGFPFGFYRPVFDTVRRHKLPLLGLNVPREWVRAVGMGGFSALPPDAKSSLPSEMSLDNKNHRMVFDALMGGHPGMSDDQMKNIYAAQVLWDEAMADTIIKDMARRGRDPKTIYVVIAGSGHVMYGQGINYRLDKHGAGSGPSVVMFEEPDPVTASKGIADYIYVSAKAPPEPK